MKAGWQKTTLGAAFRTVTGSTPPKNNAALYGKFMPLVKPPELRDAILDSAEDGLSEIGAKVARTLPPNSILVSCIGNLGKVGLNRVCVAFNQQINAILPDASIAIPEFMFYQVLSCSFKKQLEALASGTTVPIVNKAKFNSIEVVLPRLSEQQRIVGVLGEAFASIATSKANAEKNLLNARALFDSHLQSVFTPLRKGWVEKRLDQLCTISSGGTPSKNNNSYWDGKIPWVSGRDMKSTRLSDSLLHISQVAVDESSTRVAPAGTLLILVRGMGLAHGAQIAELMVPCAFNQDIKGIHANPGLLPRYLLFALRHKINLSDTILTNAAHGTLKLDSNELQKVIIPFPRIDEQQRIVDVIDSIAEESRRLATIYAQKLVALDDLKKSLLHQAFTDQL